MFKVNNSYDPLFLLIFQSIKGFKMQPLAAADINACFLVLKICLYSLFCPKETKNFFLHLHHAVFEGASCDSHRVIEL